MAYQFLLHSKENNIGIVTVNRPKSLMLSMLEFMTNFSSYLKR